MRDILKTFYLNCKGLFDLWHRYFCIVLLIKFKMRLFREKFKEIFVFHKSSVFEFYFDTKKYFANVN